MAESGHEAAYADGIYPKFNPTADSIELIVETTTNRTYEDQKSCVLRQIYCEKNYGSLTVVSPVFSEISSLFDYRTVWSG